MAVPGSDNGLSGVKVQCDGGDLIGGDSEVTHQFDPRLRAAGNLQRKRDAVAVHNAARKHDQTDLRVLTGRKGGGSNDLVHILKGQQIYIRLCLTVDDMGSTAAVYDR